MTWRRTRWPAAVLAAAAGFALLSPGSPAYLPNFFGADGRSYDGYPVGHWVGLLGAADPDVRYEAIHALGAIGPDAGEAIPTLAAILTDDPDPGARVEAALALSKMAPASRSAVPALTAALSDREPFVRMDAALALMRLRGEGRPAAPALARALRDDRNRTNLGAFPFTVQEQVAVALGWVTAGTPDAVPALTDALRSARTERSREAAARALGEVGPDARPAVAELRKLTDAPDLGVRQAAREALEKIEGTAKPRM